MPRSECLGHEESLPIRTHGIGTGAQACCGPRCLRLLGSPSRYLGVPDTWLKSRLECVNLADVGENSQYGVTGADALIVG